MFPFSHSRATTSPISRMASTPLMMMISALLISALLTTAMAAGCASRSGTSETVWVREASPGILVTGEGESEARPDVARFRVGVEARRDSVAQARQEGAEIQQRILTALRGAGLADADLQTTQLSLQPEYEYSQEGRKLLGYTARNQVEAKVTDLSTLSRAIDAAVTAGGDDVRMEGISFELSDPDAARAAAREEAVANARAKAEQLARLSGAGLGRVIAIAESTMENIAPRPMMLAREEAADQSTSTPVEPGETTVRVRVEVRFAIE